MANWRWSSLALLSFLVAAAGCSVRHRAVGRSYRITQIGAEYFVIPPGVPYGDAHARRITVGLGDLGARGRADRRDCAIRGPLFALRPGRASDWVAELPPPQVWEEEGSDERVWAEFTAFLSQLHSLQARHCFPDGGEFVAKSLVLESLAVPAAMTILYLYSYRLGTGFIDVVPGMRLRVERAAFRPTPKGDQTLANYLGTRTAYYELSRNERNEISLRLTHVDTTPGLAAAPDLPDTKLASQTVAARLYRLFFLTKFVPPNRQRAALLVGTRDSKQLEEITGAIQGNPEIACSAFAGGQVTCVAFDGAVSLSTELKVQLNGQPSYVPVGSTLRTLLAQLLPQRRPAAVRNLRIQRLFHGRYANVEFDRGDSGIMGLVLLGGDKISW